MNIIALITEPVSYLQADICSSLKLGISPIFVEVNVVLYQYKLQRHSAHNAAIDKVHLDTPIELYLNTRALSVKLTCNVGGNFGYPGSR